MLLLVYWMTLGIDVLWLFALHTIIHQSPHTTLLLLHSCIRTEEWCYWCIEWLFVTFRFACDHSSITTRHFAPPPQLHTHRGTMLLVYWMTLGIDLCDFSGEKSPCYPITIESCVHHLCLVITNSSHRLCFHFLHTLYILSLISVRTLITFWPLFDHFSTFENSKILYFMNSTKTRRLFD